MDKLLEEKIMEFYFILNAESKHMGEKTHEGLEASYWLRKYKEHFNIETKSKGEIKW